jgi:hypothetical protein
MNEETFEQLLEPLPRQEPVQDEVRRGRAHEGRTPRDKLVLVDLEDSEDMVLEDENQNEEENDGAPTNPPWSEGGTHSRIHDLTKLTRIQSMASSPISTSARC